MPGSDEAEDSPKRRSTFYVALEGEGRRIPKSESDKFSCNTFPIGNSKSATGLSRTLSDNEALSGCEQQIGKVQSLTRIFEGPSEEPVRKKVERTRSFKTIEKFQNRFSGRKEQTRKDGRLNCTTTGCERNVNPPATLSNLLIRRTHSTKLARSTSTLAKIKRDKLDRDQQLDETHDHEIIGHAEVYAYDDAEADAAVHSGRYTKIHELRRNDWGFGWVGVCEICIVDG